MLCVCRFPHCKDFPILVQAVCSFVPREVAAALKGVPLLYNTRTHATAEIHDVFYVDRSAEFLFTIRTNHVYDSTNKILFDNAKFG